MEKDEKYGYRAPVGEPDMNSGFPAEYRSDDDVFGNEAQHDVQPFSKFRVRQLTYRQDTLQDSLMAGC